MPVARHVGDLDFAVVVKVRNHDADGRLDAMCAGFNAVEVGQRSDHADRPVAAHPEIRDVVEKQHTGYTRVVKRRTKERTDKRIRTAWLIDHRGTEIVVFGAETFEAFGKRTVAEVRPAANDDTRRLTRSEEHTSEL